MSSFDQKYGHLRLPLKDIQTATNNFADGFGNEYKGQLVLSSGQLIDILARRLDRLYGTKEFQTEIMMLSSLNHQNIVSIVGFCDENDEKIVINKFEAKGILYQYLSDPVTLTWAQRLQICLGIARALSYIHYDKQRSFSVIHRDVCSFKILLGDNWEAKLSGFELSIMQPAAKRQGLILDSPCGTHGYWDPAYIASRTVNHKSDVYSFGVVLFEVLTGRNTHYHSPNLILLVKTAKSHYENGNLNDMIHPDLEKQMYRGSLKKFSEAAYCCLNDQRTQRPHIDQLIFALDQALKLQLAHEDSLVLKEHSTLAVEGSSTNYWKETHKDSLLISFEDIKLATQNFNNLIGKGSFWNIYRGEILRANVPTPIAVKRHCDKFYEREKEFLLELEILFEYKHENIIGFLGYYYENNEKILVYEYASNGSLDRHVNNASLTWTQRLKIGIDVAIALDFLHGGVSPVVHRDIKSGNILLHSDWKAKVTDFGLSMIAPLNDEFDFVIDDACGTPGYVDPQYQQRGFLTRKSDIYSLGVVLFEMMCGRVAYLHNDKDERSTYLVDLVKQYYEEGKVDELVFECIKDKIMPESLTTFQRIVYQCLSYEREHRPTASDVVSQLKKALEFQEDIEVWEAKLPGDYKELIQMSKTPAIYTSLSKKDLYDMFSKGILLQEGKLCLSVGSNGERNEMISATMFSYENNKLHKQRYIQKSRFQRVLRITDVTNLKTQIKIKTQFLSPNMIYGAYLIFKFGDPRKFSNKPVYVNLKYKLGSDTLHAYFATWKDDEWLMIELCRLLPRKKDVDFEVLLESMSRHYCGKNAIYVEGIHFQAIANASLTVRPEVYEKVTSAKRDFKAKSDSALQVSVDYDGNTQQECDEKLVSLSKVNEKKCHTLPAKMVLCESSNVKCFKWKSPVESSARDASMGRGNISHFEVVAEFISHQVFEIKCEIETQKLSLDTDYACHLVFKLSQKCHGLHCPVKVLDLLDTKNKEAKFLYFRSPRFVHLQGNGRVPKHREDGLMEVIVWEFNSGNDDHVPMSLKLRCYEGNMSGLIVHGIEFRPYEEFTHT